jgi:hypothetical protein
MYISNGSFSPVSDTFIPEESKKSHLTTDQNLIKGTTINDEFLGGS